MDTRPRRVAGLALAFFLAACTAQVAAPRPSDTPAASPSPTPRVNLSNDTLYVRSLTNSAASAVIVLDAHTGRTMQTYPDAVMSPDRKTLFWMARAGGATQTIVHVVDVTNARELRSFPVDGNLIPATVEAGRGVVTPQGDHLVLTNSPYRTEAGWITKVVLVDTTTGKVDAATELKGEVTYGFAAIAPDARSLLVNQYGEGSTGLRIFDTASGTLLPAGALGAAPARSQNGFRSAGVLSPDGRWLFSINAGDLLAYGPTDTPFVLAVDLVGKRAQRIALPIEQKTWDFEKYLLWSLAVTPDGTGVYAVNPALGVIDELDVRAMRVRRTAQITVSAAADARLVALWQALFPAADAKRYITGGAVLSPDGRTIYAAGMKGVAVIDRETLGSRMWEATHEFDHLALAPDGARLYATSNTDSKIMIIDTRDGASLGTLATPSYAQAILRIDPRD
jgi:hypothetical protein